MKMSKLKKTILITVIILVILVILIPAIGIRLAIRKHAKEITPELGPIGEYFSAYDMNWKASDDVQTITYGAMTLTVPDYFVKDESSLENTCKYSHKDEADKLSESIIFTSPHDQSYMNVFSEENMEQFKQMSAMMQMMNEMGGSPEEALQGFLSEEQMAMFKMFGEDLS